MCVDKYPRCLINKSRTLSRASLRFAARGNSGGESVRGEREIERAQLTSLPPGLLSGFSRPPPLRAGTACKDMFKYTGIRKTASTPYAGEENIFPHFPRVGVGCTSLFLFHERCWGGMGWIAAFCWHRLWTCRKGGEVGLTHQDLVVCVCRSVLTFVLQLKMRKLRRAFCHHWPFRI